MVLHAQQRNILIFAPLTGVGGGEVIRMQIANDHFRLDIKQVFKVRDLLPVIVQRFQILQIAYMLRREYVAVF